MYRLHGGFQSEKVLEAAYVRLPIGLTLNITSALLVWKLFAGHDTRCTPVS